MTGNTPGTPRTKITADILSRELLVLREVYRAEKDGTKIGFNALVRRLEGLASRATVSSALDVCFDQGLLNVEWGTIDGHHARVMSVSDSAKGFAKVVSEAVP